MTDDTTASDVGAALMHQAQATGDAFNSNIAAPVTDAADEAITIAKENTGLVIAGGIAAGLLAAALWPRSKKKKLARRSKKISALVSELSAALATQAGAGASVGRDQLGGLGKSMSDTVSDQAKEAKKQAGKMASVAADQLNDSGKVIARTVVNLIEKMRG